MPVSRRGRGKSDADANENIGSILDHGPAVLLDSGTSAISLALRSAGVRSGDEYLVTAYNCPSMVDPAKQLGLKVRYYRIHADTSVDLNSVREQITERSSVMLVPHLFGRAQDISKIRSLCDETGLRLIEDCAHTFFVCGPEDSRTGRLGDFVVGSSRKFLVGADGGCLVSAGQPIDRACVRRNSPIDEIRAFVDWVEETAAYDGAPRWTMLMQPLLSAKNSLRAALALRQGTGPGDEPPGIGEPGAKIEIRAMSRISRYLLRRQDANSICRRRRQNYAYLESRFSGIPGLDTLPGAVGPGFIPYMYPLVVTDAAIYPELMKKGIPVWRWDYSDTSCDVSRFYAEHLIQVPCHQSLSRADLDEIADEILGLNAAT